MTQMQKWGSRLLAVALCLCGLFGMIAPVAAVPQPDTPQFLYTTQVYYRPAQSAKVLGQLSDGTALTVLDDSGNYWKIDCYGYSGYIAKSQVRCDGEKYYVNCDGESPDTKTLPCVTLSDALLLRSAILELARCQLGTRYVYGGMAPGGFDCSGLTTYVYGEHSYALHRCADEQMQDGLIVSRDGLQVGDLVFFRESWTPWLASHVGIYAGDGKIIHAKSGGIRYSDLDSDWYARYYVGARRIVNVQTLAVELDSAPAESAATYTAAVGMRTIR